MSVDVDPLAAMSVAATALASGAPQLREFRKQIAKVRKENPEGVSIVAEVMLPPVLEFYEALEELVAELSGAAGENSSSL